MYGISVAAGSGAASGVGAALLPSSSVAHQALAFTGFALGAYVVVALMLILAGLILRWSSGTSHKSS